MVELTNENNPREFKSLSTIQGKTSVEFIRSVLGFTDFKSRTGKVESAQKQLKQVQPESIPLEELPQAADETSEIVNELIESEGQTESETQTEGLNYRELVALDKSLQMVKRNLELNQAKLDELDAQILETRNELDEAQPGEREDIERRLKDLEIERRGSLVVINRDTDQLSSQVNRIKETIDAMLDSDTTLREKNKNLILKTMHHDRESVGGDILGHQYPRELDRSR